MSTASRRPACGHAISIASGVSRTFQLLQVFPQLSVRDNLILAGQEHQGLDVFAPVRCAPMPGLGDAADQMIEFFRLSHLADEQAGSLSYGQQKLLDAAMAFMAGPRLVLLDEPAGGVNLTMLGAFARAAAGLSCRTQSHFRRDRAPDGIRHGAVHARAGAGGRTHDRRGRAARKFAAIRP